MVAVEDACHPLVQQNMVSSLLLRNFDDCIRILDLSFKLYKCELSEPQSPVTSAYSELSPCSVKRLSQSSSVHAREYELCVTQKGWAISRISSIARLAQHDDKGICVVAFCGSVTQEDWETNLNCRQTVSQRLGGGVHTGYLLNYESLREDILRSIMRLPRRRWTLFSIGFGSGGGYATLALHDIVERFGKMWHGAGFNNVLTPKFLGYFIGSPPIVTQSIVARLNDKIGKDNMLSQFADADLFCNGWSTLIEEIVQTLERMMDTSAAAEGLLAQVRTINWQAELDAYCHVGQFAVQTVQGASLQYESVQELQLPSATCTNAWILFRYVLTSLGLTAHLGGSMHDGEFVRWLVERPTAFHLEKGQVRMQKMHDAQVRSAAQATPLARKVAPLALSSTVHACMMPNNACMISNACANTPCAAFRTNTPVKTQMPHVWDTMPKISAAILPSFAQNRAQNKTWKPSSLRASLRPQP